MKKIIVEIVVLVALCSVAFIAGLELGHRKGYDTAWGDCKFDAKQQLFKTGNKAFWDWYGSNKAIIRKHRSFFR